MSVELVLVQQREAARAARCHQRGVVVEKVELERVVIARDESGQRRVLYVVEHEIERGAVAVMRLDAQRLLFGFTHVFRKDRRDVLAERLDRADAESAGEV